MSPPFAIGPLSQKEVLTVYARLPMLGLLLLFMAWPHKALVAGEAALSNLRYVISGNTSVDWPMYIAQEKKLFQKNGIYLEPVVIRGATNTTRAVLSGTVPLGRINPDYVITGIEKGAKAKIIAGTMEKIPYDLVARPEIKSGAELKGKTIGVSSLTGGTTLMLHEVMEKAFKLREGDYKLLVVGTSPDRYAAIKGGSVQATFMGPPFNFRAAKDGFTKLTTFYDILGPIQFAVEFAYLDYLRSHRDETVRYLKSWVEGTRWLYDPKNKEEALAIHMKALKGTKESAELDYQFLIQDLQAFPKDGSLSKAGMTKSMDLRVKDGMYKEARVPSYTEYVDNTFLEEALRQLKH